MSKSLQMLRTSFKYGPETLGKETPDELGEGVADGKPAEDQPLLLGAPLELTVAVVTTMAL